jgi:hypothetical protein
MSSFTKATDRWSVLMPCRLLPLCLLACAAAAPGQSPGRSALELGNGTIESMNQPSVIWQVDGGPYLKIASTDSTYSTYLDTSVVNGTIYYYVVREATYFDEEKCRSNQAAALPAVRGRR